ncbi:threonine ammonia-lyase [Baekduia soli]|uniref:L-threonine dehydratase catabolic TdcB n=1 Tax=Baekduia soli TaxID=496014 RepID=A0A5B8U4K1_9ACTN|nr:threonine ammonia-lyase [Baekduia soli]QEC48049.1 threonine ammonia-lyase [Baekduia soli]
MSATGSRSVDAQDVARARAAIGDIVRHTPVLPSATLTELGGQVMLKAESLQRTGAFKIRGALSKLAALGDGCAAGVVCGSAGNHAQALALAARERGVPCDVYMPEGAPIAKVEATTALGARVILTGTSVDDCLVAARQRAQHGGLAFVHPFDDPDVVAGQGTLGLELLEDLPDLATVIVPVGGGGLASGVAIAVKSARPEVRVVGVQVASCAAYPASLKAGHPIAVDSALTIADGIAVKRPGDLTLALISEWLDDLVVVGEDEVAEAMVLLMEKAKLVVEGAGAVGVAALLGGEVTAAETGSTCVILSGGNVDAGLLATVARRHETEMGRRMVLMTRVPDRPGALARLLDCVAATGANIVDVAHLREGIDLHVRETGVQLTIETRSREHADAVVEAVRREGYGVSRHIGAGQDA